jgi:hypothetical protein
MCEMRLLTAAELYFIIKIKVGRQKTANTSSSYGGELHVEELQAMVVKRERKQKNDLMFWLSLVNGWGER